MRTIGGINGSNGKLCGQPGLGVKKIMWRIFHLIKR
jgi:hypothetical protein